MLESLFGNYDTVIFFDCETTGFNMMDNEDQIIELAALKYGSTQLSFLKKAPPPVEMDDFIKLHCKMHIPEKIVSLTGITDMQLYNEGKEEEEVISKFMELFVGRTLLVAYNAHFDLMFLCWAILRQRAKHPMWLKMFNAADYLDPCSIHRDRARQRKTHKLADAIEYFNLSDRVANTHRAIDDTKALMEVTRCLEAENNDLIWYVNRMGWIKKPPEHPLKKVTYLDQSPWHSLPQGMLYERER